MEIPIAGNYLLKIFHRVDSNMK